jgi:hypothetical protein
MRTRLLDFSCFYLILLLTGTLGQQAIAQQTFFNSPAAEIIPTHGFYIQNQVFYYNESSLETRSRLVYGLGDGYDIGFAFINRKTNLDYQSEYLLLRQKEYARILTPLFQMTGQKEFVLNSHLRTVIGTKIGLFPSDKYYPKLTHFTYKTWVYTFRPNLKVSAGLYLTDKGTVGKGNIFGLMIGFKYPLSKRLLLIGDFTSGNHREAVSVLGLHWLAGKRSALNIGVILPNPGSETQPGLVLGLTLFSFDRKSKL